LNIGLSASGLVLAQTVADAGTTYSRLATDITGANILYSDVHSSANDLEPLRLSPDGSRIAAQELVGVIDQVNFFTNGTLSATVSGAPAGWLDNHHMLVNSFASATLPMSGAIGGTIYDESGTKTTPLLSGLPVLSRIQTVGTTSIYSAQQNTIYSLTDGLPTWTSVSSPRRVGAIAGPFVVFASGASVRAEPY
jgi:hypothetical protein